MVRPRDGAKTFGDPVSLRRPGGLRRADIGPRAFNVLRSRSAKKGALTRVMVRRQQHVPVVIHQHMGMQPAGEPWQRLTQALQMTLTMLVVKKTRQTIVAPLHHVLRATSEIETWKVRSPTGSRFAVPATSAN